MTAALHAGGRAGILRAAELPAPATRETPRPTTPLCPTTPGGIPIRLLVDSEPRSRARRALPLLLLVALAAGIAAVALAGCGASPVPPAPGDIARRFEERAARARAAAPPRVEAGPGDAVLRVPPLGRRVAPVERAQ